MAVKSEQILKNIKKGASPGFLFRRAIDVWADSVDDNANSNWILYNIYRNHTQFDVKIREFQFTKNGGIILKCDHVECGSAEKVWLPYPDRTIQQFL